MTAWLERVIVKLAEAIAVRLFQFVANRKHELQDVTTPGDIKKQWHDYIEKKLKEKQ
jgi:hypothetical protein